MPYTKIRCSTCAAHLIEDSEPTPAEYAFLIVTPPGGSYQDDKLALMNHPQFSAGFMVGVEGFIEYEAHPFPMIDPEVNDKVAWLAGFVAGQYSNHAGFATPVCKDPNYEGVTFSWHEDGEESA